jgi:hypothetical protein
LNVISGTTVLGETVNVVDPNRLLLAMGGVPATVITSGTWVTYTNSLGASVGNGGEDYEDWFTIHGSDYLIYAAMCQLNLKTNTFAPRTEGFNPAPEKARDKALLDLRTYDTFEWEGGRIAMRKR